MATYPISDTGKSREATASALADINRQFAAIVEKMEQPFRRGENVDLLRMSTTLSLDEFRAYIIATRELRAERRKENR